MQIKILLFGIVSDLIKTNKNFITIKLEKNTSLKDVKKILKSNYQLNDINDFMIAVNESYEKEEYVIKEEDVLAIIPPVSGG